MRNLTFHELQEEQAAWAAYNFDPHDGTPALLGAVEELGELAHAHLKAQQGIRGTKEQHAALTKDAVADVIIYLADYCTARGYDLQTVVEEAWDDVARRDWRTYPQTGRPDTGG